jgi:hypothetical protein
MFIIFLASKRMMEQSFIGLNLPLGFQVFSYAAVIQRKECRSRVTSIPASFLGGSGSKCRLGEWLS